jgi:hypothetical protein
MRAGEKISIWILHNRGGYEDDWESPHVWHGVVAAVDHYAIRLTDAYLEEDLDGSSELIVRDMIIPWPNIAWIAVEGTARDIFQDTSATETSKPFLLPKPKTSKSTHP